MIKGIRNFKYYLSEVRTILKLNGISSLLSVLSLSLIFFVTALTLTGWRLSTDFAQALKNEAEISAYYPADLNAYSLEALTDEIQDIEGVKSVDQITAETAYDKMSEILGQEAKILAQFDENPFEAYLEISIELSRLDEIVVELNEIDELDYVRDNKSILDKISQISGIVGALGIIMTLAVGISTFIITSHIIREGVHAHRDRINTLQLLGAPDGFIHMPFILEGMFISTLSGLVSTLLYLVFMSQAGRFTKDLFLFMPTYNTQNITWSIALSLCIASIGLGWIASVFGLRLVKKK